MALLMLAYLLADIFSVAYLFIGYYLWREWQKYHDTIHDEYARRCLYGAIAFLVLIVLGKSLIKILLGKSRKKEDEPHMVSSGRRDKIKRPDGTEINIEYAGKEDGQSIIFVHGWNSNSKGWYYQRKHFEKDYRLIMIDLPGLGRSTRPKNRDFSLTKMAADLRAVIAHTNSNNPILWGHSIGGMIILTLLAKTKDADDNTIKGVVLEHTTYTDPLRTSILPGLMTAIRQPVVVPVCWLMIIFSPIIWISRWMSYLNGNSHIMTRLMTFAGTQTPKQLDFVTLLSTLAPPAVTARGMLAMLKYDVTSNLQHITVPVLIIAANRDRLTRPEASIFMSQHMPHSAIVTVAPGGHQGLIERHREVNEAAEQFIRNDI